MNPRTTELTDRQKQLLTMFALDGAMRATFIPDYAIPDWAEAKQVFLAFGARWVRGPRGKKGHFLFPNVDAMCRFERARKNGDYVDPKANDFFPTPVWLADELVARAEIRNGDRVLEPSAGQGAIVMAIRRAAPLASIHCCELLPDNRAALRDLGVADLVACDFLEFQIGDKCWEPYDAIVMNPPFDKDGGQAHVLHALTMLRKGGSLVAVMSAGVGFWTDKATIAFRNRMQDEFGGRFEANPDDAFKEAGTMCRTLTLVIPRSDAPVVHRDIKPENVFELNDDPDIWVLPEAAS